MMWVIWWCPASYLRGGPLGLLPLTRRDPNPKPSHTPLCMTPIIPNLLLSSLKQTDDVHARASDGAAAAAADSKKRRKGAKQQQQQGQQSKGQSGRQSKDEEFGVTRGIDFKGVRTIVNYDLPASVQGASEAKQNACGGTAMGGLNAVAAAHDAAPVEMPSSRESESALSGPSSYPHPFTPTSHTPHTAHRLRPPRRPHRPRRPGRHRRDAAAAH